MKIRARLAIYNYITSFCLSRRYGEHGPNEGGFEDNYFFSGCGDDDLPMPGDLVALSSAPTSEWHLSWYVGMEPGRNYYSNKHLLESVETGEICNWCNVGFMVLCRDVVKRHPEWRWTDAQWAFRDRWFRVCKQRRDAYMTLPVQPVFDKFGSVTLGTRKRYGLGSTYTKKFPNWRKVRIKDMLEFYDQTVF